MGGVTGIQYNKGGKRQRVSGTVCILQRNVCSKRKYDKLRKWAANTNFYGRWMPEHGGSIDFRWNEFPWADSYRHLIDAEDTQFNEGGVDMMLAYEAQLQEYFTGMKDEYQFLTTTYLPCRKMMEAFNWHTAERGIIRDSQGVITAINREIPDEPLHALLILRDKTKFI